MTLNGNLSTKQVRAIATLLECPTVKAAAEKAEVGERTIHRWLKEERFKAALLEAEQEAVSHAARRIAAIAGKAIDVLATEMEESKSPKVRVSAAKGILTHLPRIRLLGTIEPELTRLQKEGEDGFNFERGQEED